MIVQNEKNIVPLRDPKYTIIARALKQLIYSNKNLFENTDWTITIIHRMFDIASFPNVMILPVCVHLYINYCLYIKMK